MGAAGGRGETAQKVYRASVHVGKTTTQAPVNFLELSPGCGAEGLPRNNVPFFSVPYICLSAKMRFPGPWHWDFHII